MMMIEALREPSISRFYTICLGKRTSVLRLIVASSNLTTLHNKTFRRKVEVPHREPDKYSPWVPTIGTASW